MVDISRLKIGDKVCYRPSYNKSLYENGRVISIPEEGVGTVFVVYKCAGEWNNFMNYTAQSTRVEDLEMGWKHDEESAKEDCEHYFLPYGGKYSPAGMMKCQFCHKIIE